MHGRALPGAGQPGPRYLWAPASSFLVGSEIEPASPGENRLGVVRYELDGAALKAEIIDVPGLARHWLDDVINEVYPNPARS